MFVEIILLWSACLLVYLSSSQQKLLLKRPGKVIVWLVFTIFIQLSWNLFRAHYSNVSAGLFVLSTIITMWVLMVLVHGHSKLGLFSFALGGGCVCLFFTLLGGLYVA